MQRLLNAQSRTGVGIIRLLRLTGPHVAKLSSGQVENGKAAAIWYALMTIADSGGKARRIPTRSRAAFRGDAAQARIVRALSISGVSFRGTRR